MRRGLAPESGLTLLPMLSATAEPPAMQAGPWVSMAQHGCTGGDAGECPALPRQRCGCRTTAAGMHTVPGSVRCKLPDRTTVSLGPRPGPGRVDA